jgi:hypothetical protein
VARAVPGMSSIVVPGTGDGKEKLRMSPFSRVFAFSFDLPTCVQVGFYRARRNGLEIFIFVTVYGLTLWVNLCCFVDFFLNMLWPRFKAALIVLRVSANQRRWAVCEGRGGKRTLRYVPLPDPGGSQAFASRPNPVVPFSFNEEVGNNWQE